MLTFFLQIYYKNRRKYLNEHQTKQSKTKQNPNPNRASITNVLYNVLLNGLQSDDASAHGDVALVYQ